MRAFNKTLFLFDCRISHDSARYPRFLPEAYCLCKGCLTGPNGEESDRFRSIPVYVPTVVLRRVGSCAGGRHSYIESYVSVAVGCTCLPVLEKDRKTRKGKQTGKRVAPKTTVSTLKHLNWADRVASSTSPSLIPLFLFIHTWNYCKKLRWIV